SGPLKKLLKAVRKGSVPEGAGTAAGPALAALRDATARASDVREAFSRTFDVGRAKAFRAAQEFAADKRFREAVAWQNRAVIATMLEPLTKASTTAFKDRRREELVASYLQRYCAKNDTIGFFGPICWVRIESTGDAVTLSPHDEILAKRGVYFEQWG